MRAENIGPPGVDIESFKSILESLDVAGYEDPVLKNRRGEDGSLKAANCWAYRGCSGLMGLVNPMQDECPHNRKDCYSPCPAECSYTICSRPWHRTTSDVALIFDQSVERRAAVKKACYTCEYFLTHGPRVGELEDVPVVPEAATKDSASNVTIHLF